MRSRLTGVSLALAARLLPPYDTTPMPAVDLHAAMIEYNNAVMAIARGIVQTAASDRQMAEFRNAATVNGYVGAGAWAQRFASANEQLVAAVHAVPKVAPPKVEWWSHADGRVHGVQLAILGAEKYFETQMRRNADYDAQAYLAGVQEDSFAAIFDISRRKALYNALLAVEEDKPNPLGQMVNVGHSLIVCSTSFGAR